MNLPFRAIACDYDGTLAEAGQVAPATLSCLRAARAAGYTLILITGRRLDDLRSVFPELLTFHLVIAENGALLFNPARQSETPLCPPPPATFLAQLRAASVPFSCGRRVVASVHPHDRQIARIIGELELDLAISLNRESVMVLPTGIDKASGMLAALGQFSLDDQQVIGFGDAENDIPFLRRCGFSVAVNNALDELKKEVDLVAQHDDGAGVTDVLQRLMAGEKLV